MKFKRLSVPFAFALVIPAAVLAAGKSIRLEVGDQVTVAGTTVSCGVDAEPVPGAEVSEDTFCKCELNSTYDRIFQSVLRLYVRQGTEARVVDTLDFWTETDTSDESVKSKCLAELKTNPACR
jgi:hypothetical protein